MNSSRSGVDGLLTVIGAINWDISVFEDRFARPGEEVPVRHVEEFSGGKGANVAVAAARILGPRRVALIGALGDDEVSAMQVASLRDEGVITGAIAVLKGRRSGRAYIIVDGGGRKTIHTHFGSNDLLQPTHITRAEAKDILARSRLAIIMDAPLATALVATQHAKEAGSRVIYSPGVRAREGLKGIERIIRQADTLVLDRNELTNLSRIDDIGSSIKLLTDAFPDLMLVTTLGRDGCIIVDGGAPIRFDGVSLGAIGMRAVNSTGSGDAFLGAFATYTLLGKTPSRAAAYANLAGALKATRIETRGSPKRKELERQMRLLENLRRSPRGSQANRASSHSHRR